MTAEVAIYNRSAITLAADSAVSISSGQAPQKIYNNAEKLFAITKHHPVGLMIYGSSDLLGIPWELIIKQHRVKLGTDSFPHLKDYAVSFFEFVEDFFNKLPNEAYYHEYQQYIAFIITDTFEKVIDYAEIEKPNAAATDEVMARFAKALEEIIDTIEETSEHYCQLSEDDTINAENDVSGMTLQCFNEFFGVNEKIDQEPCKSLIRLCALRITKVDLLYDNTTGLVFAGYGNDEFLPQMYNYDVYGFYDQKLKYYDKQPSGIEANSTAGLQAFAQRDEVDTFMQGVSNQVKQHLRSTSEELFHVMRGITHEILDKDAPEKEREGLKAHYDQKIKEAFSQTNHHYTDFVERSSINKVVHMIKHLPKNEMAYMAESLVNLTAFKRKVSNDSDTVGGPIDVAVISKGDGFVWVKRKHYFDNELNKHYDPRK